MSRPSKRGARTAPSPRVGLITRYSRHQVVAGYVITWTACEQDGIRWTEDRQQRRCTTDEGEWADFCAGVS